MNRTRIYRIAWIAVSIFLVFAGTWFLLMEFVLRHPGYIARAIVGGLIVLQSTLSLVYAHSQPEALRVPLMVAALCSFVLGVYALTVTIGTTHFEGYILLISLGLIDQSAFTVFHTARRPHLRPA